MTGGPWLTLLEPQSRCGDKPLKFQVVCPQNGTAVLKGLIGPMEHTKKLPGIYFPILTDNVRSYLLWSPVIVQVGALFVGAGVRQPTAIPALWVAASGTITPRTTTPTGESHPCQAIPQALVLYSGQPALL